MARQISTEEFQELGRSFYKLKQYDKALETFTKGIETCQKPTLNLYDYRAATYEKLGNLIDAVKDGRQMIKLNKTDVKGYLRTANVLEKMGKEETALEIYKYGMKNVGVKDKNFKLLQQLHNRLTRKLSPAIAIDPFSILPVELAEMILEYLPFRHIVNCMRVSKGWHSYLSKLPKLWMHLDLRGARKPVPRSFVNSAFKYSGLRMTSVTLHRFEHMDVFRNLVKAAKHLTEVEIISLPHAVSASLVDIAKNRPSLKKLVVYPAISADAMEQIFDARPELEHVAFHAILPTGHPMQWTKTFTHLHTLSLSCDLGMRTLNIELAKLIKLMPSLRALSLCNVKAFELGNQTWSMGASELPPLTKLILKHVVCEGGFLLPPTLQHLVVDNDKGDNPLLWRSQLPDLTHLSYSGFSIGPDNLAWLLDLCSENGVEIPFTGGKPLQHLSLHCLLDTDATLFHGPKGTLSRSPRILTPALHSLDLATMPCTDDDVEHLLTFETGLTTVDLSNTNVTGASIKMLVDKLPSLKYIKVDNCTRINGRDAIDYAERKGVAVSYRIGEQKGGRRIRYG